LSELTLRHNVRAVLEDGLAGLIGIREGRCIEVDHHLVSLSRGAGIDAVVEGRLRELSRASACPVHPSPAANQPLDETAGGTPPARTIIDAWRATRASW